MAAKNSVKKPLSEIIYVTVANLRGHQSLYKEGWFFVSASDKALRYAKEQSITASGQAFSHAVTAAQTHSTNSTKNILKAGKYSVDLGKEIFTAGTGLSKRLWDLSRDLSRMERKYGAKLLLRAKRGFIEGYRGLSERTVADRAAITAIPGRWSKAIKSDSGVVFGLMRSVRRKILLNLTAQWVDALGQAAKSFHESYEKSGECGNSLCGLAHLLVGYSKVMYAGMLKPVLRSGVQVIIVLLKVVAILVILPVALVSIVCGRTLQSVGICLYHILVMAVKLLAPAVDGIVLTGLALLLYCAIPLSVVAGAVAVVVINTTAIVVSPVACVGAAVILGTVFSIEYAARLIFSIIVGVAYIVLCQIQAVIALGYNVLTALPVQLLLGSMNIVVFLAFDLPRLTLAVLKGEVLWPGEIAANDA